MLLIVHVYFNLFLGFGVPHREAISDLDFLAVFAANAEKGTDDALLVDVTAE